MPLRVTRCSIRSALEAHQQHASILCAVAAAIQREETHHSYTQPLGDCAAPWRSPSHLPRQHARQREACLLPCGGPVVQAGAVYEGVGRLSCGRRSSDWGLDKRLGTIIRRVQIGQTAVEDEQKREKRQDL